jgi:hypothetical protein
MAEKLRQSSIVNRKSEFESIRFNTIWVTGRDDMENEEQRMTNDE